MCYPPLLLNSSSSRRNLLHRLAWLRVFIFTALGGALNFAFAEPTNTVPVPGLVGPIFNQDSSDFFFERSREEMSGELVDAYIDQLAQDGVRTFVSCVNAMRTNYASRVWEPDWTGYDEAGPDNQPILRFLAPGAIVPTRRRLDSAKRLADLGVNFHQRALARCRQLGVGAWVSVRMNDVHDCTLEDAPLLSSFFKAQRAAGQLRAPHRNASWTDRALDWERPEVQEHYFKLVCEQLETLDLDGLELDWMRFVYHFRPGHELAGGRSVTAWLQRVRAECDRAAVRLGHPVRLSVRVPSRPETARRCGLDAVAWAQAGLIDLIVATPFWATAEFDLPTVEWKRLLAGTGVSIAGGLEIRYQPVANGKATTMTPELAAGAAMALLHQGADYVYLFNYFPGRPGSNKVWSGDLYRTWGAERYRAFVQALSTSKKLEPLARTHAVTYRDIRAPGDPTEFTLPGTDPRKDMPWPSGCAIRLPTGPQPVGRAVKLMIEFAPGTTAPEKLNVYVNSVKFTAQPSPTGLEYSYVIPSTAMQDEAQVIEITGDQGALFSVLRLEMAIAAQ